MELRLGLGLPPGDTGTVVADPPTDIVWAGTHAVDEDVPLGTQVGGTLSGTDPGGLTLTFSIPDATSKYAIGPAGNVVIVTGVLEHDDDDGAGLTIRATNTGGGFYDEVFPITVNEVVQEPPSDPLPPGDDIPGDINDFDKPPYSQEVNGATKLAGNKKNNGLNAIFLRNIIATHPLTPGSIYTMRYTADWSQMANLGVNNALGFLFRAGNDFYSVNLRGDGASGVHKVEIGGAGKFNQHSGFTVNDGGAAQNGTISGPNVVQIEVSPDGTAITFRTAASIDDDFEDEFTLTDFPPFTNVSQVTAWGPGGVLDQADSGPYSIAYDIFTNTPALVFTYQDGQKSDTNASAYTISVGIGAEVKNREVVIGLAFASASAAIVSSEVKANGRQGSHLFSKNAGFGCVEYHSFSDLSGTTAEVYVVVSGTATAMNVFAWSSNGAAYEQLDADGGVILETANAANISVTTEPGANVLVLGERVTNNALSCRNVTERVELQPDAGANHVVAADTIATGSSLSVGVDTDGSGSPSGSSPFGVLVLRRISTLFAPSILPPHVLRADWDFADTATITHTSGSVDSVTDKSGNAQTISATSGARPLTNTDTLDGKNVVKWQGADDVLARTASVSMPVIDAYGCQLICLAKYDSGTSGGLMRIAYLGGSSADGHVLSRDAGNMGSWGSGTNNAAAQSAVYADSDNTNWHVKAGLNKQLSREIYEDGVLKASNSVNNGVSGTADTLQIGVALARARTPTHWLTGKIARAFIVQYAMNRKLMQQLTAWLLWRYQLQGQLGVWHPYREHPPGHPLLQSGNLWTTAFSHAPATAVTALNGLNVRNVIAAGSLAGSGNTIRLAFRGGSGEDLQIASCKVGHAAGSGDAYDTDSQTTVTFRNGATGVQIPAGQLELSDPVPFDYDEARALVITTYHSNSLADNTVRGTVVGSSYYTRSAADESELPDATTGYTQNADLIVALTKVEVSVREAIVPGFLSWRFYVTAFSTANSMAELEFYHGATKHDTTGATVISSHLAGAGGSGAASVLFDGDLSAGNYWSSVTTLPGWVGATFPTRKQCDRIAVVGRAASQWPTAGLVQGSNDGGLTWVTKFGVTNLSPNVQSERRYANDPLAGYKHHRIRFASMPSGAVRLGDAQFRDTVGGADVSGQAFQSRVSSDVIGIGVSAVFDNNSATHWAATTAATVECYFGPNVMPTLAQIWLRAPSFNADQAPVELRYDTSVDGTNWTLNVFSQTGLAAWSANEVRTFNL